jgi:hypothetical protein
MPFKPNQSYSESDAREQRSIDFINGLLRGTRALSELKYGDKGANIDGYIQLLDTDRCIEGKLTVQVKTVSPCNEGKDEYPCPTSLFAYAERTTDVVFLMAVDHSQNVVLWKYISRPLINENQHKADQDTITLHFDNTEKLTKDNVSETIGRWSSLFLRQRNLIIEAEDVKDENEKLRQQLVTIEAPIFTIPKSEVVKIQRFSDAYNGLLDKELSYVKKYCYPGCWKQGIAILEYKETELLYALYSIKYGENSLLIKQLPKDSIRKIRYNMACHSFMENKIKDDIPTLVREKLSDDVKKIFKEPRYIPPYENYIIEYIHDFVRKNSVILGASSKTKFDYAALKSLIEQRYTIHGEMPTNAFVGYEFVNLRFVCECIDYLLNRGYKGDAELYPPKGQYGNTGMVSDWYNSETAFEKTKNIFNYVYATYTDFIEKNFPYIKDKLDMYYNADFVLINLNYDRGWPILTINYFYRTNSISPTLKTNTIVEFSLEQEHQLYKDYPAHSYFPFIEKTIKYNEQTYECTRSHSFDSHKYLFGRTCLIDTFYAVFKERLEEYIKNMQVVVA